MAKRIWTSPTHTGSELPSSVQEQNLGVLIDSSLKTLSQHSVTGKEENCVRKYKERNKEQKGKVYAVIYSCAVAMFQMLTSLISLDLKSQVVEKGTEKDSKHDQMYEDLWMEQRLWHFSLEKKDNRASMRKIVKNMAG